MYHGAPELLSQLPLCVTRDSLCISEEPFWTLSPSLPLSLSMILGASAEEPHAPFRAAAARMCMCQYVVFGGGAWGAAADVYAVARRMHPPSA